MPFFQKKVLSDDGKRKQYDAWGTTSDQFGAGGGPTGGTHHQDEGFSQHWTYNSQIDPEEFFRKIFGDRGFHESDFSDFTESRSGHNAAREVSWYQCVSFALLQIHIK